MLKGIINDILNKPNMGGGSGTGITYVIAILRQSQYSRALLPFALLMCSYERLYLRNYMS